MDLVAYSLEHEGDEDANPHPVRPAKAGAIEQGERSEERTAEGNERGERQLPLASGGVDAQQTFVFGLSGNENQEIAALHKEQEHKQSTQ